MCVQSLIISIFFFFFFFFFTTTREVAFLGRVFIGPLAFFLSRHLATLAPYHCGEAGAEPEGGALELPV